MSNTKTAFTGSDQESINKDGRVPDYSETENEEEDHPLIAGNSGRASENLTTSSTSDEEIDTSDFVSLTGKHLERKGDGHTTNTQSLMHLLKGNMGTGILAMASAVKNAGLWTGFAGVLIIGTIATHCMHQLVNCSHRLCARTGRASLDYGEVAEEAFRTGPQRIQSMSRFAKHTINVFLCLTQFGFCIVYVLFVADNVKQVVEEYTDWVQPARVYMVFVTILLIPYAFVRKLKHLAPFSAAANLLTFIGLLIIFIYCFQNLRPHFYYKAFNSWASLPMFFGTAMYAFEAIGVVLPIENKMKTPQDFPGLTGVLNTGMVIVTVLYACVGFFGYLTFGDTILGSITLNLPTDHWLYVMPKLIFSVAIFITYGVQFYVPAMLIIPPIKRTCCKSIQPGSGYDQALDYALRTVFVLVTFGLAAIIPHLDLMISLVGALASSTLALIFPPILESIVFRDQMGRCKWKLVKNILICIIGVIGFVTGTLVTIIEIIKVF